MSSYKNDSELYYVSKTTRRYICVIVKICENENFISTAFMIKISRLKHHYTQQQIAAKLDRGLLPYQRLESGKNNPTLKTLLKVKKVLPDLDLSKVA